jgi:hypothetical protein
MVLGVSFRHAVTSLFGITLHREEMCNFRFCILNSRFYNYFCPTINKQRDYEDRRKLLVGKA